jgi:hypothetical protein
MMMSDVLQALDAEVVGFPRRASGEQLYEHINKVAAHYAKSDRLGLVVALTYWLQLRSEPKTMIAVDLAGKLHLNEVRSEIEKLLVDVEQGKAFMPFYVKPIKAVLEII